MGWLAGYGYRKPIPITGEAGAGTDYQVRLEVHPGAGSDGDGVVYLSSHGADFPNDVRFTDDDGTTELDHWLEEFDIENNQAIFWIKVADDLGSNQDIYIYYGKAAASDSDGDATFPFFDDFEAATLDAAKWDVKQGAVDLQTDLVPAGVLELSVRPSAQYHSGTYNRTYFVTYTPKFNIEIRYYDHDADVISRPAIVHTYAGGLDNHDTASLLILADGKILVFYGPHNGALYVKKSTNAEDISAWGGAVTIEADDATYRQPILLSNGDVWIFYRYNISDTHKTWCYRVSDDDGASWGGRTTLVDFGSGYWIYGQVAQGGDTIHVTWFRRTAPGAVLENVYYIYSPDNGTTWKMRDGTIRVPPIDAAEADLVYDSPIGKETAVCYIELDGSNNPYIAIEDDLWNDPADALFAFYDAGWETHFICDLDLPSGNPAGIVIDENDVFTVYVGVPDAGKSEIQKWTSPDSGDNWGFSESITDESKYDNYYVMAVRNGQPAFKLLWCVDRYFTTYENYDNGLLADIASLNQKLELENTSGVIAVLDAKTTFDSPKVFAMRVALSKTICGDVIFCASRKANDYNERAGQFYADGVVAHNLKYRTYRGGAGELTGVLQPDDGDVTTWHRYKVRWNGLDDSKAYIEDTLKATHTSKVTDQTQVIWVQEGSQVTTGVALLDWVFVRKYNDPEPIVGTAGAEEEEEEPTRLPRSPAYGLDPMIF